MVSKLSIEEVHNVFRKKGLILLETTYTNSKTKMLYICKKCGYTNKSSTSIVSRSKGCPKCNNSVHTYSLEDVQSSLQKEGYTLLSNTYKHHTQRLYIKCKNNHITTIAFRDWVQGCRCRECYLEDVQKINISKLNLPLFITYAAQLELYHKVYSIEQTINNEQIFLLGVNCTKCNTVFIPNTRAVVNRLNVINGKHYGEANFYCSEECKKACSTFGQIKYLKDNKPYKNTRPDQKAWAFLIKERDNYTCQKCGAKEDIMYAHHIDPVVNNPIESMDLYNGITLCKSCHKEVHKLPDCSYNNLKCN